MTCCRFVDANSDNSRSVPALFAGKGRGNLPKTLGRFSSGGRGRRFESSLPDQHFRQSLGSRRLARCRFRCRYALESNGPMEGGSLRTGPTTSEVTPDD